MALICSVALSTTAYAAGSTPPPSASIVVTNTGSGAVVVTGVQLSGRVLGSSTPGRPVVMGNALPPYGPGAPVVVAAGGVGRVGPFAVTAGMAANANGGVKQPTQVPIYTLMVGAVVFGSDGSRNVAAEAGLTVSWPIRPQVGTQGAALNFSQPGNSARWFF